MTGEQPKRKRKMLGREAVFKSLPGWGQIIAILGATIGLLMQFQDVKTRQAEVVKSQARINRAFRDEHRDFRALFLDLNADVRSLKAWREYGAQDPEPPALSDVLPVPNPLEPAYRTLVEQRLGKHEGGSQG